MCIRDRKMAMFRDHGQAKKYYHSVVGWNGRMDGIQGAILSIKLKHLNAWTDARRSHAAAYTAAFKNVRGVLTPKEAAQRKHVYHLYVLRVRNRDRILKQLADRGVNCAIHYPVPLHLQEAYASLGVPRGSLPISERCAQEIISLPMFPELTPGDIQTVASSVASLVQENSAAPALAK